MRINMLSRLLFAGLLLAGSALPSASNVAMAASELEGSALPPGINPTSPAGGNGGDAQGYDKKPVAPPAAGTDKVRTETKASRNTPANKQATTPSSERKYQTPHKKTPVTKP